MPGRIIEHEGFTIHQSRARPFVWETQPSLLSWSAPIADCLWLLYMFVQCHVAWSITQEQNRMAFSCLNVWLLLLAEACASVEELRSVFTLAFSLVAKPETAGPRPQYSLLSGNGGPTVDIFIPCCGEPVPVIMDTLYAAATQDYPHQSFRIFVLDDGNSSALRVAVEGLHQKLAGKNKANIFYLSRVTCPGPQPYYKSGNLQFGITESERRGGSEYIASLDADMIPNKDWLRRMVPHLLLDHRVALACPPQLYYNVPDSDPFGQQVEFDLFLDAYEPLDDRLDPAMCTGSGLVARRSSINAIGGWPQVNTGEDFIGSAILSHAGWKVAFIREPLQVGLAPSSLKTHVKQRERWVDSGIVVHKYFGFYLPGSIKSKNMSWTLRAVGVLGMIREYAPIPKLIGMVLLPLAMPAAFGGDTPVSASRGAQSALKAVFLAWFIMKKVNYYLAYRQLGLQRIANLLSNDVWCAPFTAFRCVLSLLPAWTSRLKFEATGSIISDANERSTIHRKPLPQRLFSIHVWLPSMYACLAMLSILPFVPGSQAIAKPMFPGPFMVLVDYIPKAFVPFVYMIRPPTVQERDALIRVSEDGSNRPTEEATASGRTRANRWWLIDVCEMGILLWCMV